MWLYYTQLVKTIQFISWCDVKLALAHKYFSKCKKKINTFFFHSRFHCQNGNDYFLRKA